MVSHRIGELDREWDVERMLETNAAAITLVSIGLAAAHSRRWLLLTAAVPAFLLQHAIAGWRPPASRSRRRDAGRPGPWAQRLPGTTMPVSYASTTSCARSRTSSFMSRLLTWVLTVA